MQNFLKSANQNSHKKIFTKSFMKIILIKITFLVLTIFFISSCNWNRTEKAQQQKFASGPDAPSALSGTLQRNLDYYTKSDSDLLKKMR